MIVNPDNDLGEYTHWPCGCDCDCVPTIGPPYSHRGAQAYWGGGGNSITHAEGMMTGQLTTK